MDPKRQKGRAPLLRARRLLAAGVPDGRYPVAATVAARKQKREYEHAREAAKLAAGTGFDPGYCWHEKSPAPGCLSMRAPYPF
jgi:hypothetical protein